MTIEELFNSVPASWVISFEQPKIKWMVRVEGKRKSQPVRYSAYVCNGEDIGTKAFQSAWKDSDSMIEALSGAIDEVHRKMKEKLNEARSSTSMGGRSS